MWDRGREELTYLGITPQKWLEGWKQRIARGDAVSFGEAILGCDWEDSRTVCTSFQATRAFEDSQGLRITKEMRREIPRLMEERGAKAAFVYSLCVDPGAEKWFRLLGFREDMEFRGSRFGPYIMRRFWRRQ